MKLTLRRTAGIAALATAAIALALAPISHGERTVFTSNSGSLGGIKSITPFSVNADGSLTPGAAMAVGARPEGVAVTPDARFLYVATSVAAGVRAYAIGASSTLAELPGSPFSPGAGEINTTGVAVTPSGNRLLATNRGTALNNAVDPGSISVFNIDQSTGALSTVAGSPFAAAGIENHEGVAIAPGGGRAFVVGDAAGAPFDGRVAVLSINAATGALTSVAGSPFNVGGTQPFPIAIAPGGGRVFVGNVRGGEDNIEVASVNPATGALAAVAGSPFPAGARAPIGLGMAPDGMTLFSGDRKPVVGGNDGISAYLIGATGALTTVAGSPFATGRPEAVAATPDGGRVFGNMNTNPGGVGGFSIGAGSALAPLGGSPYPTGDKFAGFFSIAMTPSNTPKPALTRTPAPPGLATAFDASATTVPGGRATRFDWDFGDGTTLADGGPTPTHVYTAPGTFAASVTVTNDCDPNAVFSGTVVFTGQTAHCNGATQATATDPPAAAAICRAVTSPVRTSRKGRIRLSAGQFRINQRIYAEALRRARAINAWLNGGVEARDLCGGGIGGGAFNAASVTTGPPPSPQPARPGPTPRPIVRTVKKKKTGVRFTLSVRQLRINQAIASRAVREANALKARLNGGLTGGDVDPGAVTAAKLATNIGIAASTPLANPPAASRTVVAAARRKTGVRFQLTDGQVAVNQKIGQAAIRRLRVLQDRLQTGLTDKDLQPSLLTAADLG